MTTQSSPVPTIEERIKQARQNLEKCFKEYHRLLNDKVLDSNKSEAQKNVEKKIVDDLHRACLALESLNVGEGLLSMAVIAIREHLKIRDRVNELEYELFKTKRDIAALMKELGIGKNVKEK